MKSYKKNINREEAKILLDKYKYLISEEILSSNQTRIKKTI